MTEIDARLNLRSQWSTLFLGHMHECIASPHTQVTQARWTTSHGFVWRLAGRSRDLRPIPHVGCVSCCIAPESLRCTSVMDHRARVLLRRTHCSFRCTVELLCTRWSGTQQNAVLVAIIFKRLVYELRSTIRIQALR